MWQLLSEDEILRKRRTDMTSKTNNTPSTKDWRNLPLDKWNVTTFHVYLTDRNREEYDVTYVPFGQGPISKRWVQEKGQLKQAIQKYGNDVVKLYIDKCFVNHKYNAQFPVLSFGFCWTYMRNELAQAEVEAKTVSENTDIPTTTIDESWF